MLTRADQARTRQRLFVASLLIKLSQVLAPRRMDGWALPVRSGFADWLSGSRSKLPRE
jgi:hypothetical protein